MELHKASWQWNNRPDDERFPDLNTLHQATLLQRQRSLTSTVMVENLRAEDRDGNLFLKSDTNSASLSHWSFGQLAARCEAPPNYLRSLPAPLAVGLLNHGIKNLSEENRIAQLLLWNDEGGMQIRAMTGDAYARVWNHSVVERLQQLPGQWTVPPAMDKAKRPSGLYAGDHDMFAFMIDSSHCVDDGSPDGLGRGFFVWNSEVGAAAFGIETFYYRYVCGNHIVWGATNVISTRIRHVGIADERAWELMGEKLNVYLNASPVEEEQKIKAAQRYSLGSDEDEVVEKVFRLGKIPKKTVRQAYQLTAGNSEDGSPRTIWGLLQGLTRVSQQFEYADARTDLDRAAASLMRMVA